jgi:hypothetical protein
VASNPAAGPGLHELLAAARQKGASVSDLSDRDKQILLASTELFAELMRTTRHDPQALNWLTVVTELWLGCFNRVLAGMKQPPPPDPAEPLGHDEVTGETTALVAASTLLTQGQLDDVVDEHGSAGVISVPRYQLASGQMLLLPDVVLSRHEMREVLAQVSASRGWYQTPLQSPDTLAHAVIEHLRAYGRRGTRAPVVEADRVWAGDALAVLWPPLSDTPQETTAAALEILRESVTAAAEACVYDRYGNCRQHGSYPEHVGDDCRISRGRDVLTRLGYTLQQPTLEPMEDLGDEVAQYLTAAVATELALTPLERGAVTERVMAGLSLTFQDYPVCVLLALGVTHNDAPSWTGPDRTNELGLVSNWVSCVGASRLPANENPTAWRRVIFLAAAYLHGRCPTTPEFVALARRALSVGLPRLPSDEGIRLTSAYQALAEDIVSAGMSTDDEPGPYPHSVL